MSVKIPGFLNREDIFVGDNAKPRKSAEGTNHLILKRLIVFT